MEILLTRHGQTEWNFLQKVQGKADIKLNEKYTLSPKQFPTLKNEINKIAPNISDNLVAIREKRRQLLKKIVKEIKKELDFGGYKYNKEKLKTQLEKIYELIDKCFDSVV